MRSFALSLLLAAVAVAPVSAREWTDNKGNKLEGDFIAIQGDKVTIRRASDQKIFVLGLEKLSAADQEYAKTAKPVSLIPTAKPAPAPQTAAPAPLGADRFSEAIKADPQNPSNWVARGIAKTNQDKPEEAIADFNQALKLDPKNAAAYNGRGRAYGRAGDAAKAHEDYSQAIELNPKFAPAYRNRAENAHDFYKTPEGKEIIEEELAKARRKRDAIEKTYLAKFPWQPRHVTKDKSIDTLAINNLVATDRLFAEKYERENGPDWGYGGYGGAGGGGIAYGGGVVVEGNGVVYKGGTVVVNPALAVYPKKAVVGETITLIANPSELAKGMPQKIDPKAPRKRGAPAQGTPLPVKMVDFYRDVNGDAVLQKDQDEYLATDADGSDGFSAEVPTNGYLPGSQNYFAVPKGDGEAEGSTGGTAQLVLAQNLIKAAADTERNIAQQAEEAVAAEGLSAPSADALGKEQSEVAKIITDVARKLKASQPEVAAKLTGLRGAIGQTSGQLRAAKNKPGAASKPAAANAANGASTVANELEGIYDTLAELSGTKKPGEGEGEGEGEGDGKPTAPPTDEKYAGSAAPASGELVPAPGAGPGGPGKGGPGNGDDDDKVVINKYYGDDDDDVNINLDGDDVRVAGLDDYDEDSVALRATDYLEDRDYDGAIAQYDRILKRRPADVRYLRDRAGAYLARGSYDYAIRDYDRMIELAPRNADFYYNRGCARLAAAEVDGAIDDFTMSIKLDELGKLGNLAYNNRGSAYAQQRKYELAIKDFDAAIKVTPEEPLAYRNRALAYKLMGKTDLYQADLKQYQTLSVSAE